MDVITLEVPSGNHTWQWKIPYEWRLIGKSPIDGPFSIDIFDYRMVLQERCIISSSKKDGIDMLTLETVWVCLNGGSTPKLMPSVLQKS